MSCICVKAPDGTIWTELSPGKWFDGANFSPTPPAGYTPCDPATGGPVDPVNDGFSAPGVSGGSTVDQNGDPVPSGQNVINFYDDTGSYINSVCITDAEPIAWNGADDCNPGPSVAKFFQSMTSPCGDHWESAVGATTFTRVASNGGAIQRTAAISAGNVPWATPAGTVVASGNLTLFDHPCQDLVYHIDQGWHGDAIVGTNALWDSIGWDGTVGAGTFFHWYYHVTTPGLLTGVDVSPLANFSAFVVPAGGGNVILPVRMVWRATNVTDPTTSSTFPLSYRVRAIATIAPC